MNFFFDENLSPNLTQAIGALHRKGYPDDNFFHIDELFPLGTGDDGWIDALTERRAVHHEDWAIVTRDQMRDHWGKVLTSGFFWFILDGQWGRIQYWDTAWRLVRAWPEIIRVMGLDYPGADSRIFSVNPESEIQPRLGRA